MQAPTPKTTGHKWVIFSLFFRKNNDNMSDTLPTVGFLLGMQVAQKLAFF